MKTLLIGCVFASALSAQDAWEDRLREAEGMVVGNLDERGDPSVTEPGAAAGSDGSSTGASNSHSAPRGPVAANEAEPNNSIGTATTVPLHASVSGSIGEAGDHDFFRFEIERPGAVEIVVQSGAGSTPMFRLFDRNFRMVKDWMKPSIRDGATEPEIVDLGVAGAYHVQLADADRKYTSTASYTLRLRGLVGDEHEPSNGFDDAARVDADSTVRGNILPRGDVDFWQFEVERCGAMQLRFARVPSSIQPSVRVYRGDMRMHVDWTVLTVREGASEILEVDLPAAGKYYVLVADSKGDERAEDEYVLEFHSMPGDRYEPADDVGSAVPLRLPAVVESNLLPLRDQDFFTFEAVRGAVRLGFRHVPADMQPSFRVLNGEGRLLRDWTYPAVRDGATDGDVIDLPVTGRYYVVISERSRKERTEDRYQLALDPIPGDEYEPSDELGDTVALGLGAVGSGNLVPRGDIDHWSVPTPGEGVLQVAFPNVPPGLTISFRVYDREARMVHDWQRPPIQDGAIAPVDVPVRLPGLHYVVVAAGDRTEIYPEPYTIRIGFVPK